MYYINTINNMLSIIYNIMSQLPIDKSTMLKICENGTYYNPASNHYDGITNVVCDKCYRDNLNISIGWQSLDLCLSCVDEINKYKSSKSISSRSSISSASSTSPVSTSSQVKRRPSGARRMLQRQFRK